MKPTDLERNAIDPARERGRGPDAAAPGRRRRASFRPLLADPAFRWLLIGQGLALLADQTFYVALTWLVLERAGPGTALGVVLGVAAVPGVILLPAGGWLVDRVGPVRLMVLAGVARVAALAALAALAWFGGGALWQIALLGGLLSAVDALYYPAALAAVPVVVPASGLVPANGLLQGLEQVTGLAGPAVAGGAIALAGLGPAMGAVAVVFAGAVLAYAAIARALATRPGQPLAAAGAVPTPAALAAGAQPPLAAKAHPEPVAARADLFAGLRHVLADPLLRTMCLILAALNVALSGPITVGGAVLAEQRFGGAGAFALLMSCWGAGALAGSLGAGTIGHARRRGPALLAATALLGLGLAGFGLAPTLLVAAAVSAGMGLVAGGLGVVVMAWLQERTPEAIRGQVLAVVMFAAVALDPLALTAAGFFAAAGPTRLLLAAGALLLLAAALGTTSRVVRAFD